MLVVVFRLRCSDLAAKTVLVHQMYDAKLHLSMCPGGQESEGRTDSWQLGMQDVCMEAWVIVRLWYQALHNRENFFAS